MADHIAGKVVIITGAGSGFGRLVSQKAAALGAKIVAADINADALAETESQVKADGGEIITAVANVSDLAQMKAMVAKAVDAFGAVDVMMNNAGIMPLAFFSDHEAATESWHRCIDINIKGVLNGMIAVYDQMVAQGRGQIINLSSIYGNFPVVGAGVYGASKAAVNFLSESMRVESQGKIKVTIIKPTGVPATNLSSAVINSEAVAGILGHNVASYGAKFAQMAEGDVTPEEVNPDHPNYLALDPTYIADAIIYAINQPWGVSMGDITVRATGDGYVL